MIVRPVKYRRDCAFFRLKSRLEQCEIDLANCRRCLGDCSQELNDTETQLEQVTAERDAALAALHAVQEPLTLDELRQMDENPVWVEDLLIPECSAWHLLVNRNGEKRLFDTHALCGQIVEYNATTGENYGKTWLAYRGKPGQEETHG